jgi:hypothetical protein
MNKPLFDQYNKALSSKDFNKLKTMADSLEIKYFNKYHNQLFLLVLNWRNSSKIPPKLIKKLESALIDSALKNQTWIKHFCSFLNLFSNKNLIKLTDNFNNLNEANKESVKRILNVNLKFLSQDLIFKILLKLPPSFNKTYIKNLITRLLNYQTNKINLTNLAKLINKQNLKLNDFPLVDDFYVHLGIKKFITLTKKTKIDWNDSSGSNSVPLYLSLLRHKNVINFDWMTEIDFNPDYIEKSQIELFDWVLFHKSYKLFDHLLNILLSKKKKIEFESLILNALSNNSFPIASKLLDKLETQLKLPNGQRRQNILTFIETIIYNNASLDEKIELITKLKQKGIAISVFDLASFLPLDPAQQVEFKKLLLTFKDECSFIDFEKLDKPLPTIYNEYAFKRMTKYSESNFYKIFNTQSKFVKKTLMGLLQRDGSFDVYLFYLSLMVINKKIFNVDLFINEVSNLKSILQLDIIDGHLDKMINILKKYYPEKRILSWFLNYEFISTVLSNPHNSYAFLDGLLKINKYDKEVKFLPKKADIDTLISKVIFYSKSFQQKNEELDQDSIMFLDKMEVAPFTIRVIKTKFELIESGAKMRNCLGDGFYFDDIKESSAFIFVLDLEDKKNEIAVAVFFDNHAQRWEIKEIQSKFSKEVDPKIKQELIEILATNKPDYTKI